MKKTIPLMLAILFALTVSSCDDDNNNKNPITVIKDVTLTGKITTIGNPCNTVPCLPGIVAALETDIVNYVITVNNSWFWSDDEIIIGNDTLQINDSVEIFGNVSIKKDLNSNTYYEIEVLNLYR